MVEAQYLYASNNPIKELDELLESSKTSKERGKNMVDVKNKDFTLFTPQVSPNFNFGFGT
jgi:hypothetical protein